MCVYILVYILWSSEENRCFQLSKILLTHSWRRDPVDFNANMGRRNGEMVRGWPSSHLSENLSTLRWRLQKNFETLTVKSLINVSLNGKTFFQFWGLFKILTNFTFALKTLHDLFKIVTIKSNYRQANLNKYGVRNPTTTNSGLHLQKLPRRFIAALKPNVLRQMELST